MTSAIAINILLSAVAFAVIVGLVGWAILTSRPARIATASPARRVHEPAIDHRRQGAGARLQSPA